MKLTPIAGNNLEYVLDFLRRGGELRVQTALRVIVIDRKTLCRFDRAGAWLLKPEGDGYRLRTGQTSIYLFPGQLQAVSN